MSAVGLTVVIVSWNTRKFLSSCLRSVLADPLADQFEICVVDNASSDGSAQLVRRKFPQVRLRVNHSNQGFAKANNLAIRDSEGAKILLLNPDTNVEGRAISTMLKYLDANPKAGAVGPLLVGANGRIQNSASPAPSLMREFSRMFHLEGILPSASYDMDRWALHQSREVEVLQGACLMIRRKALVQVGLLDEDYFMYSEEVDLCHRLRMAGWQIYWVPQAQVIHHGEQSTRQAATEMFLQLYRAKIQYFRKRQGRFAADTYKTILLFAALARLLITPLTWLERPEQRQRHWKLAKNYRKLLTAMAEM